MLIDIHSPLIDHNLCRNVDTRGDVIDVTSLPICHLWQHCLRVVCDLLQQVLLPPIHPAHHKGSVHDRYINQLYYQSIGGINKDGNCSFASHKSAHKLVNNRLQWLNANDYYLMCELESYAKDRDGFITINLPQQLCKQLSKQWERETFPASWIYQPRGILV